MRKSFKKALSLALSAAMTLTLGAGTVPNRAAAEDAAAGTETTTVEESNDIVARLGYQTEAYDFRNTDNVKEELAGQKYAELLKEMGKDVPDYNNYFLYSNGNGVTGTHLLKSGDWALVTKTDEAGKAVRDADGNKVEISVDEAIKSGQLKPELYEGATVTDAKVDKDGTYTVKIEGLNLQDKEEGFENSAFRSLYIAVNVPYTEGVKATAKSLKIDGEEIASDFNMPQKYDADGICDFMIANQYNSEEKEGATKYPKETYTVKDKNGDETTKDLTTLTVIPKESIEVEFELTGVDWTAAPVKFVPEALETPAPIGDVTPPPVVPLSKPFDIAVFANVCPALTPKEGAPMGADGITPLQSALFSSSDVKAKIDAAKDKDGKAIVDTTKTYWVEEAGASASITQTGVYSLSVTAKDDTSDLTAFGGGEAGAIWMPLFIDGGDFTMPADYNLLGTSIQVGDATYSWPAQLMQETVSKNVRLSVVNQWATAVEKALENPVKEKIAVKKGDVIKFNFMVVPGAPAPAPVATPSAVSTAPATSYDAYLGFQTDVYTFREMINNDTYGINSKELDYKKEVGYWSDGKLGKQPITSTDATMTENGVTYTVGISGLNLQTLKGAAATDKLSTAFNMLFVTTDIPLGMKGVTMKNAALKIDGNVVKEYTVVPCKGDASDYYVFMLADGYAPADGTKDAAYPSGDLLKVLPADKMEVTYTMEGIDFDRQTVGPKKGKTFEKGDFKYKVTKAAIKSGDKVTKGAASVVGLSKAGKKKASVSLAATAKGTAKTASGPSVGTYKVTAIKAGAFKGASKLKTANFKKATNVKTLGGSAFANCKKLTSVTFGKKMTKIPASTFKGCKKLSKLTFSAKLKSVSKSAFKGCKKKIKIAGTGKAANKKKIKKAYKKVK